MFFSGDDIDCHQRRKFSFKKYEKDERAEL